MVQLPDGSNQLCFFFPLLMCPTHLIFTVSLFTSKSCPLSFCTLPRTVLAWASVNPSPSITISPHVFSRVTTTWYDVFLFWSTRSSSSIKSSREANPKKAEYVKG